MVDVADERQMKRYEVPSGATVELLTELVPGSRVRMTDGRNNPRNTHRGLSSKELSGELPWGVYSAEEVEATDAPVWVQGGAIGSRYLLDRTPVAYTFGCRPRWPNPGANVSMGHWILMARQDPRSSP